MLGVILGGGILFALAGTAFGRWRERRALDRSARQREVVAAEYRAGPAGIDRWQERQVPVRAPRGAGTASNRRANLTAVGTPQSPAGVARQGAIGS
jgi:hypothetical protein